MVLIIKKLRKLQYPSSSSADCILHVLFELLQKFLFDYLQQMTNFKLQQKPVYDNDAKLLETMNKNT